MSRVEMGVAKHPQLNHTRRDATMEERNNPEREDRESPETLTILIRSGAREMIVQ